MALGQVPKNIANAYEAAIWSSAEKHQGKLRKPVALAWRFDALVRRSSASRAEKGVLSMGLLRKDAFKVAVEVEERAFVELELKKLKHLSRR